MTRNPSRRHCAERIDAGHKQFRLDFAAGNFYSVFKAGRAITITDRETLA